MPLIGLRGKMQKRKPKPQSKKLVHKTWKEHKAWISEFADAKIVYPSETKRSKKNYIMNMISYLIGVRNTTTDKHKSRFVLYIPAKVSIQTCYVKCV